MLFDIYFFPLLSLRLAHNEDQPVSKMGRYVYQLQEAEEREQYDQDRTEHSNPATHPLARVTIFGDGDQRIIPRPSYVRRRPTCPSVTPTSGPVPKAQPPEEI